MDGHIIFISVFYPSHQVPIEFFLPHLIRVKIILYVHFINHINFLSYLPLREGYI